MFPSNQAPDKPASRHPLTFASQPLRGLISLFSLISLKHSQAAQSFEKEPRSLSFCSHGSCFLHNPGVTGFEGSMCRQRVSRPMTFEHIHDSSSNYTCFYESCRGRQSSRSGRSRPVVHFWHLRRISFEGFEPHCSVSWWQASREYVQGLALLSIWPTGSVLTREGRQKG